MQAVLNKEDTQEDARKRSAQRLVEAVKERDNLRRALKAKPPDLKAIKYHARQLANACQWLKVCALEIDDVDKEKMERVEREARRLANMF